MTGGSPALFLGFMLLALGAPGRADDNPIPPPFRGNALVVSIHAFSQASRDGAAWDSATLRYTMAGAPVGVRLIGTNIVAIIQVTPFDRGRSLVLVSQGMVWIRHPDGELAFRSAMDNFEVEFGQPVIFYPLGRRSDGDSPLRVEIVVERYREGSMTDAEPGTGGLPLPAEPPEVSPDGSGP